MKKALIGMPIDQNDIENGLFTKKQVKRVYNNSLKNLNIQSETFDFKKYETTGNRLMIFLTMVTVACYESLKKEGLSEDMANTYFYEIGWSVYKSLSYPAIFLSKLRYRAPQKQLNTFIKLLCMFPFSQDKNGYQYKVWEEKDRLCTDWHQCAPHNYIKSLDNPEYLKLFQNSWCQYDFFLPQLLNPNGHYERTKTLSCGDEVCDMKWYSGGE